MAMCLVRHTKAAECQSAGLCRDHVRLWQTDEQRRRLMPFQLLLQYHFADERKKERVRERKKMTHAE